MNIKRVWLSMVVGLFLITGVFASSDIQRKSAKVYQFQTSRYSSFFCSLMQFLPGCGEAKLLQGHEKRVTSVAFSPDGMILASSSSDKTIKIWEIDAASTIVIDGIKLNDGGWVETLAFGQRVGGSLLLAGGGNGTFVKMWEIAVQQKQSLMKEREGLNVGWSNSVTFSPDGKTLASGAPLEFILTLLNVETHKNTVINEDAKNWVAEVTSVAFSPDGKTLASGLMDSNIVKNNVIKLWAVDGDEVKFFRKLDGGSGGVSSLAFSPDGIILASGAYDYTIKIWNARDWQARPLTLKGHSGKVTSVAFSPDVNRKILASGSADNTINIWKFEDKEATHIYTLKGHDGGVNAVAFSPDGNTLASGSGGGEINLILWNLEKILKK